MPSDLCRMLGLAGERRTALKMLQFWAVGWGIIGDSGGWVPIYGLHTLRQEAEPRRNQWRETTNLKLHSFLRIWLSTRRISASELSGYALLEELLIFRVQCDCKLQRQGSNYTAELSRGILGVKPTTPLGGRSHQCPLTPLSAIAYAIPILCRAASLIKGQLAHTISSVQSAFATGEHLARRMPRIRGRHIHDGVVGEEVARTQQQVFDRFHRHDGEVFRRRDTVDQRQNVCQSTTSSSSIDSLPSPSHSGSPHRGRSPLVWWTCLPAGQSWSSLSVCGLAREHNFAPPLSWGVAYHPTYTW